MLKGDARWPFWPKLGLRIAQIVFSLIVLGLYADLCKYTTGDSGFWWVYFSLTAAILGFIASIFLLVTFLVSTICSPLIALILDAILVVFFFIGMVATGAVEGSILGHSCTFTFSSYYGNYSETDPVCQEIKGAFAIIFITFLLFVATLVLSALMFHKHRRTDIATSAGIGTSEPVVPAAPVSSGYQGTNEQPMMMNNQQPVTATSQQYHQPQGYTSHPQFISPVTSPAPNYEQQNKYMETATPQQQHSYEQPAHAEMYQSSVSPAPQGYQQTAAQGGEYQQTYSEPHQMP